MQFGLFAMNGTISSNDQNGTLALITFLYLASYFLLQEPMCILFTKFLYDYGSSTQKLLKICKYNFL